MDIQFLLPMQMSKKQSIVMPQLNQGRNGNLARTTVFITTPQVISLAHSCLNWLGKNDCCLPVISIPSIPDWSEEQSQSLATCYSWKELMQAGNMKTGNN